MLKIVEVKEALYDSKLVDNIYDINVVLQLIKNKSSSS